MAELTSGTTVAGYRIEAVLGHGSTGTVYSAADLALERRVALKVLTGELARDERFRERFLRESKLAASLEHPHIVPIYTAGEADGLLYLAMRYVDGRDLGGLLASLGRLDPERALAILEQVADALDAAHARGLVHRDVKPANILLGSGDYAYLCDFGLAKHASTVSSLTGSRAILGTVDYLAPEQIEARPVDGRVDVYALGCVLYECLTGEPPHRRGNELAALLAHVNDPAPKASERRTELPAALDDVLATALAKDRELRFATCAELIDATRAALSGEAPAFPEATSAPAPAVRTFVFADVRGYTSYTREQGDEAAAELALRFAGIVQDLAPVYGGVLQELRGDEALVVFGSARQALRLALVLQDKVAETEFPRPIGIGIDTGEAVPVEGGYRGGALNRAARLCALARPGEVLASDSVRELAGATEAVTYGFRRVERLKGFDKPVGVIEIHPTERAPGRQVARKITRTLGGTRPRLRLLATAAVVAVSVAVPLALLGGKAGPAFAADSVGLVNPSTLKPAGTISGLSNILTMWERSGQLWALNSYGTLLRIDPKTRQTTTHIAVSYDVGEIAVGAGSVWVTDSDRDRVHRYDANYGTSQHNIPLPDKGLEFSGANGVTYGAGSVWVGYGSYPFRVVRIDPHTNQVVKTFNFPGSDGTPLLAYGDGSVWIASQDKGQIWRIDPRNNKVLWHAELHSGGVTDLAIAGGYAWLPVQGDGAVWQVDPNGQPVRSITTGQNPVSIEAGNGYLFVANEASQSLSRIDPSNPQDGPRTLDVGHAPESSAVAGNRVWVWLNKTTADVTAGLSPNSVAHVATIANPYWGTDPAVFSGGGGIQLQEAVGARLLRYPDVAQPDGTTLLPEISDLPTVSNGGKTYTFHIRPGYYFSPPLENRPVTADVMRYSIERAMSPKITGTPAFGFPYASDIVGASAYRKGAAHVSGIQVHGDDLVFHLVAADPDFPARISSPFFSAVPLGTPVRPNGLLQQPIPSAGPYYFADSDYFSSGNTLVLKRNPNYHGPRRHRLQAIVIATNVGDSAVQQVVANETDYAWTDGTVPPSLALGGTLDRRLGANSAAAKAGGPRYFKPARSAVRLLEFNTQSGIFRDPRLREAVNYALDRPALAEATDDMPAEDILPPGIPGAGRTPIYPLGGPDLLKARTLAPGRKLRATLFTLTRDNCASCPTVASRIQGELARIGIYVRVKRFGSQGDLYQAAHDPNGKWDLLVDNWIADYPDPADFLNVLYGKGSAGKIPWGHATWTRYGDAQYTSAMHAAYRVRGSDRATAYRRLNAEMFRNSPPAAVYATMLGQPQVFSSRIGCQVFRPQDDGLVDLAALCIRGTS